MLNVQPSQRRISNLAAWQAVWIEMGSSKALADPLRTHQRHCLLSPTSDAMTVREEPASHEGVDGGGLSPEAADVAGVGPEEVDTVLCTRVLHIIALLCSLHSVPMLTPPLLCPVAIT